MSIKSLSVSADSFLFSAAQDLYVYGVNAEADIIDGIRTSRAETFPVLPDLGDFSVRILGLDYGSKTVGVAMTDPMGITVQPYKTILRDRESKLRQTLSEIQKIVEEYDVEKIIVGLPLNMDDTEGERALQTRAFVEKLKLRVTVPVEFTDERLTTMEAAEILDESGIRRCEQKKVIDQVAAQLILEQYLRG